MAFQWLPLRLAISKQEQALLVVSEVEGSLLFTSHLGLSAVYFPQLRHKINGVYAMLSIGLLVTKPSVELHSTLPDVDLSNLNF
ncbi:hypothetical protein Tco_0564792 [Tanacetum coccineum]